MKKFIVAFIILCAAVLQGNGQTKPMFSQYMYNMLTLNPSYAGIRNTTCLSAIFRKQWIGIEGSPETFMGSVDTKLRNKNWGLGIQLYDDALGLEHTSGVQAYSSLHLPLSSSDDDDDNVTTLSIGVGFGAMNYRGNFTQAQLITPGDPSFKNVSGVEPTAGFGMLLHTWRWYIGVSAPSLLRAQMLTNKQLDVSSLLAYNELFAIGGYVFGREDDYVKWKPSFLIKAAPGAPLEYDLSVNVWFHDIFSCGFSYRTGDAVVTMLEIQANPQLRIGYAYDYTTSQLNPYSRGTHELMLRYEFFNDRKGQSSFNHIIRYY